MQLELDGVQYNSSMGFQQNCESFKHSQEKATKKFVPVMKNKLNGRKVTTLSKKSKSRCKKKKWKIFTENER